MTMVLDWTLERRRGVSRVAIVGEVDIASTPALEAALVQVHGPLVLDCEGLTFLDSTALGSLSRVFAANSSLTLRNVSEPWRTVLEIGGLEGLVALEER